MPLNNKIPSPHLTSEMYFIGCTFFWSKNKYDHPLQSSVIWRARMHLERDAKNKILQNSKNCVIPHYLDHNITEYVKEVIVQINFKPFVIRY